MPAPERTLSGLALGSGPRQRIRARAGHDLCDRSGFGDDRRALAFLSAALRIMRVFLPDWSTLVPEASPQLLALLEATPEVSEAPIRSEIFGVQRFEQHGQSLGATHAASAHALPRRHFYPRLMNNIKVLRSTQAYLAARAVSGYDASPAAEWLLDNFHLIEAQLKEVREGLPAGFYRALPALQDEPLRGLPRIYGVAWAFVAHTDGAFNEDMLVPFLRAYQRSRELQLSELWALPTTLRVVLIENLRRLAERVSSQAAATEVANLCCDRIASCPTTLLDQLLGRMARRGVARSFVAQMAQRLQDRWSRIEGDCPEQYLAWLAQAQTEHAVPRLQLDAEQAADNLSVCNAVISLRAIGDADWPDIIERASALIGVMRGSPVFEAEQASTRDLSLQQVERIARRLGCSELAVARQLLVLMEQAQAAEGSDAPMALARYWLSGPGLVRLYGALSVPVPLWLVWRDRLRRLRLPAYLATLVAGSIGWVALVLSWHPGLALREGASAWPWIGLVLLMLFPASEAVIALLNRLISESIRPRHLPRLKLASGIPRAHRVLVVVPALLARASAIAPLLHRVQMHHLANPEPFAQFAILSDWKDAPQQRMAQDQALLDALVEGIDQLNRDYPVAAGEPARFLVLHRDRVYSATEGAWIGWERKRGKLEQLIAALAQAADPGLPRSAPAFMDLGWRSGCAVPTPYLVTLDSDTELPPGSLRELVAVAMHPENRPRLDREGRRIVAGHGILQPKVTNPLPLPREQTRFHWLFAGQCGIDPYSAPSSEVYQDVFGQGSFSGKGLLQVAAVHAVLAARLPQEQVLSHDLIEGAIARCACVSDLSVLEQAPFHPDVASSRLHRWTRGDWQLLPLMLQPARYDLGALSQWKLFDNLRRSLVAPVSLLLIVLSLWLPLLSPWAALGLTLTAYLAGPLMGALAGLLPRRSDLAWGHFLRHGGQELARALLGSLWQLALLLQQAALSCDAIVRALYRRHVSHRHLLQWMTADAAQAHARADLTGLLHLHRREAAAAALLLVAMALGGAAHPVLATLLCLIWGGSGLWIWLILPHPLRAAARAPDPPSSLWLHGLARDTWRFFERCITPLDHHLPPDNLQVRPAVQLAHRTSPTNIGLYLLSVACAHRFGWIGTTDLIGRIEATLNTLERLPRHRGHLYNWYDTQRCEPLLPMYVSTVDSGNLSGHLLAVAQACRLIAASPLDTSHIETGLRQSRARFMMCRAQADAGGTKAGESGPWLAAMQGLLALRDPIAEARRRPLAFGALLEQALADSPGEGPADWDDPLLQAPAVALDALACWRDHLSALRSGWKDVQALAHQPHDQGLRQALALERSALLNALARRCQAQAWLPDFSFLYHPKRRLMHIGFRVAEQQADAGFYDLMASESRMTSLLAIAKGDVPVAHWRALGRLFFARGSQAGLRSWSGSMFEYLMPTLILAEVPGSMLHEACQVALREQAAFGAGLGLPWGISESAYAARDQTLAYQYAPQGVPRLSLRRTPADELVLAPYATALAAQLDLSLALENFRALDALVPRTRYGFVEAIDFSAVRQSGDEAFTVVSTYMSHHQGMSIVALANALHEGVAQRWGMADPHLEAMASLLQERPPLEVSRLGALSSDAPLLAMQRRAPALLRDVVPGAAIIEPTQVLSNGRYALSLRANGAGRSEWGEVGLTRWRDDALRDQQGSFLFLRARADAPLVSLSEQPAADPQARYHSVFHDDRVHLDARWPGLQTRVTVWVSPEDDIEFRQVELLNLGDQALDLDLLSVFEPMLTDPRADEAHPAFSNLFLRAQWLSSHEALLFERRARLASDAPVWMAHFLVGQDARLSDLRVQVDRRAWLGRNAAPGQPLGRLLAVPRPDAAGQCVLDTGLDPVCVLAVRVSLAARGKAMLTFATAVAGDGDVTRAIIDKYRQPSHVQRASLMSATLTSIRLRSLRLGPEGFAAIQSLSTALLMFLGHPEWPAGVLQRPQPSRLRRESLWRLGISGDRPILLVRAAQSQGLGLVRSLAQALQLWHWSGVSCDLVVVNGEAPSYEMSLHRAMAALRERHQSETGGSSMPSRTGFHLLRADQLDDEQISSLNGLARLRFLADGRPLTHHVQAWIALHVQDARRRLAGERMPVPALLPALLSARAPHQAQGAFAATGGAFAFEVSAQSRPARPWINVLANEGFGAQVSEAGGGYTWAGNSRLHQLTAWSNDPVADPPAEWFLLQDVISEQVWSLTPNAWGAAGAIHRVTHGQGMTRIEHRHADLLVVLTWCVDPLLALKQVQVQITNLGTRTRHLRLVGWLEWLMGASRADRRSLSTRHIEMRLGAATADHPEAGPAALLTGLLCTQRDDSEGFGGTTAFLGAADPGAGEADWTCDRRELFNRLGHPVLPEQLGQRQGDGLDPCAALTLSLTLPAGQRQVRSFLIGHAGNAQAAQQLLGAQARVPFEQRLEAAQAQWRTLAQAVQVSTPDPLFDAMVNHWLLYQALSCRMWSKAGFYQAGGATGFRDQLQDALAFAWSAPQLLRGQILLAASRQFVEGDVQHWWHAPSGAGVRTRFSDDRAWLPFACLHYVRATGDAALLEVEVPFLEGSPIPPQAEDVYEKPRISATHASVYEHAARALDRCMPLGIHDLPLMGGGDWNDGMNRVGDQGRGESVWLAWFLDAQVSEFAVLATARGEHERSARWTQAQGKWRAALESQAWDGDWYRRAFFDEGQALGARGNAEGRIDLIAQAWAVLSGLAPPEHRRRAMQSLQTLLVDDGAGLIRLLDPPFVHAQPSPGYIQSYPPGVRENGGQYSHAGVWAVMAMAQEAQQSQQSQRSQQSQQADQAYRCFTYLSPAHRAAHPRWGAAYELEPYVMAGDVQSQPPHVGRGGWSWYTGAASWMHRAAIESLFGVQWQAGKLSLLPCLPSHWQRAQIWLRREGRSLRIVLCRPLLAGARSGSLAQADAALPALGIGQVLDWAALPIASSMRIDMPAGDLAPAAGDERPLSPWP